MLTPTMATSSNIREESPSKSPTNVETEWTILNEIDEGMTELAAMRAEHEATKSELEATLKLLAESREENERLKHCIATMRGSENGTGSQSMVQQVLEETTQKLAAVKLETQQQLADEVTKVKEVSEPASDGSESRATPKKKAAVPLTESKTSFKILRNPAVQGGTDGDNPQVSKSIAAAAAKSHGPELPARDRATMVTPPPDDPVVRIASEDECLSQLSVQGAKQAKQGPSNIVTKSLVRGIMGHDMVVQTACTAQLRLSLDDEISESSVQQIVDAGVVPRLVAFAQIDDENNSELQWEAGLVLTQMARGGNGDHVKTIVDLGVVPVLVRCLDISVLCEPAVIALGKIAADSSPKSRDAVLNSGVMAPLLKLLNEPNSIKLSLFRNATRTLLKLCDSSGPRSFNLVQPAVSTLARLISSSDEDTVSDACWVLKDLSDEPVNIEAIRQAVAENLGWPRLIELMSNGQESPPNLFQLPALCLASNIATGHGPHTRFIINNAGLSALLSSTNKDVRECACWATANIMVRGTAESVQTLIHNKDIAPMLIRIISNGAEDRGIRKNSGDAICNAILCADEQQIKYFVQQGCIPSICRLFRFACNKTAMAVLASLERILILGEKKTRWPDLQNEMANLIVQANGVKHIMILLLDKKRWAQQACNNGDEDRIRQKVSLLLQTYFRAETVLVREALKEEKTIRRSNSSAAPLSRTPTAKSFTPSFPFNFQLGVAPPTHPKRRRIVKARRPRSNRIS